MTKNVSAARLEELETENHDLFQKILDANSYLISGQVTKAESILNIAILNSQALANALASAIVRKK